MREVLIFFNPIAGRGRGRSIAERIARRLDASGFRVRAFDRSAQTVGDDELRDIDGAVAAAAITIGGDGTLRAAADRLLGFAGDDAARVPPLLVVPLGTANLMVRHLGFSWDDATIDEQAAAALASPRIANLDAARANGRLFLLMAGVGLDAAIVHEMDRIREGPIDLTSYALPTLLSLQRYSYPPISVEVDGEKLVESVPALAFVGNVKEYGTGFPILSLARSDDALLDVCVLPCNSPTRLMKVALAVAAGEHLHEPGVVYAKGKSVRITAKREPVAVQIDGDPAGHTPLDIELLADRLRFIVPANVANTGIQ